MVEYSKKQGLEVRLRTLAYGEDVEDVEREERIELRFFRSILWFSLAHKLGPSTLSARGWKIITRLSINNFRNSKFEIFAVRL